MVKLLFLVTKFRKILEFSAYFPNTPSKLKVPSFCVTIFSNTLFCPAILSLWELHALYLDLQINSTSVQDVPHLEMNQAGGSPTDLGQDWAKANGV